jgi:very-short-patch-repair endonuclease
MPLKNIITNEKISETMYETARQLRREMTEEERILWHCLRANRLSGLHFRNQQIIGKYIVDSYCHAASLIVEVDGEIHGRLLQ